MEGFAEKINAEIFMKRAREGGLSVKAERYMGTISLGQGLKGERGERRRFHKLTDELFEGIPLVGEVTQSLVRDKEADTMIAYLSEVESGFLDEVGRLVKPEAERQ